MQTATLSPRWYDKPVLVNILLFLFFPVGLYGLWKSNKIATWWKLGGTALIALFFYAGVTAPPPPKQAVAAAAEVPKSLTPAEERAAIEAAAKEIAANTIAAPQLVAAYQANEVKADEDFKGKTFYVSGTVTDIKKDIMDDIYVTLQGDEVLSQVQCFIEDKAAAARLSQGQNITVKGKCDGLMMNVLMKDCEVIQ